MACSAGFVVAAASYPHKLAVWDIRTGSLLLSVALLWPPESIAVDWRQQICYVGGTAFFGSDKVLASYDLRDGNN